MALPDHTTTLRRIRNHYRLIVMNEDTFEEIVAFKLNRWSVYVGLSFMFVVIVGFTIALIGFTPLKYYIPGYGRIGTTQEYEGLKVKADSIEKALIMKQEYINDIQKVLRGNVLPADTTLLKVNKTGKNIIPKKGRR
ncbi:MAG: hypothetical protein ABI325_02655 [Ginsengibacter sp.]